jgi:hypothetical protein
MIQHTFMGEPVEPGEPERDYAVEARMILQGMTGMLVEKRHLEALAEQYDCKLIKLANALAMLRAKALSDLYEL